jgi:hypothetical protein
LRTRDRIGASLWRKSGWDVGRGGFVIAGVHQQLLKIM